MPDGDETSVIPKREQSREDAASSLESPHDDEQASELRGGIAPGHAQEGSPVQKRKGGRKPLYQTTEEKKQRNRRAQAAFRERRTEHIKQLESDKRHLEERVESMEAGQRKDKDENLMLRYKNSLLERLLVEHHIDFKLEIQQKGLSYSPAQVPSTTSQFPPHRSVLQRPRKPLAVDTRTPVLRRSDSNATASAASASPVVPPNSSFTFRPPIQLPQSASAQLPGGQQQFLPNMRQPGSIQGVPNAMAQRRRSIHSPWTSGFESGLQQTPTSFSLESETFAVASESPLLQAQFNNAAGGPQYGLLGQNHFSSGAGNMGQVVDTEQTAAPTLGARAVHSQGNLDQTYAMVAGDLSTYESMHDSDPFGIDRSMQYPTQFDYSGTQRKQQ